MLSLAGDARIFMCLDPVDLRKGFEGLSQMTESLFPEKLLTGAYFVFLNRGNTMIKVLYWDIDGFVIWNKRLEKGTFSKKLAKSQIDRRHFLMMLEGITPKKIREQFCLQ